jgi:hypothetical protein
MRKMILAAPLFLMACGTDDLVVRSTQHQVVMPEESMFNCPTVDQLPATRTLTDVQVARLIVQLYQNNTICKNSMTTLRQFLDNARSTTAAKPEGSR